ncbi:hypothetical protein MF672_016115 [Actinomadura sp. ATCC 31491]|uniref:Cupin domain-containing protein n=1 Tax=Actinomadura luzonensis TaxID=2805427 RepID=A0ABT0FSI7_9ACTN|nr:hypothetical protein [Actinomadura luzonensis]MCK2215303.1 hypothetical protein [Actinomadura luzonensis]
MDVQALIDQPDDSWYNQTRWGDVWVRLGVMRGLFRIELERADTVELGPRQAFTVSAGMPHRPVVPVRSVVLMIDKAGVIATGG